jgi:hypothetical protein
MNRKTKLKDYARKLMEQEPIVTPGPSVTVKLLCLSTGKIRRERIRLDWWEDEDFRYGYEALREDDGFILVSEEWPTGRKAAEPDAWV